ncbi:MAG: BolA family protein [Pseudohongiellaceae bacterium]
MTNELSMQAVIENKLRDSLRPETLVIENESHKHGGPATESHFKLTVVAAEFEDMRAVKRHQRVYGILASELKNGVHALALHLYSPNEWENSPQGAPVSPNCLGGSQT